MPIQPPRLDDRAFHDLVAELVARIPAHTPEWTHAAPGDPGRTLIELFAWLGDTLLYRVNLIPERQRLVFLKLLGVSMRPAQPARGLVSIQRQDPQFEPAVVLRPGAVLSGPVEFETREELTVLPVTAEPLYKRRLTPDERLAMGPVVEELRALYELPANAAPYATAEAFAGGAFDLGQDTVDRTLWVALYAVNAAAVAAAREDLSSGAQGRPRVLSVGYAPALRLPDALEELPERRPLPHVWEACTRVNPDGTAVFRALDVLGDGTAGLTREGVLRLALPGEGLDAPSNDVRAHLAAGVGDRPPRIDDPAKAARLVTWLRLRPTEKLTSLPIAWVGVNAVAIDGRRTHRDRILGESDGRADQAFQLPATSVDPDSLVVQVETAEQGFVPWAAVDELSTQGRDAPVYALDPEAGTIRFGDGVRGRIPLPRARVRVAHMRAGGGAAGNLAAGVLRDVKAVDLAGAPVQRLRASQPLPTRGGADAETLEEAERRIPAVLRHRDRAVTPDDFRALTLATPGARVARVELLPRFTPHQRREDVPGAVTVMALPSVAGLEPPAPRPDRHFLEAVHAWLEPRRTLGTELYVVGAEYVPLGVAVAVEVREGFAREQTLQAVREALRAWLWPLPPGGPAGTGWPLGAEVTSLELAVPVARVPGVAAVNGLRLFERAGDDWTPAPPASPGGQGMRPRRWQLPELLSVVVVADDAVPDDLSGAANPFAEDGVPVPVVPEVC